MYKVMLVWVAACLWTLHFLFSYLGQRTTFTAHTYVYKVGVSTNENYEYGGFLKTSFSWMNMTKNQLLDSGEEY